MSSELEPNPPIPIPPRTKAANQLHEILDIIESGNLNFLRRFIKIYKFDLNQIGTESGIAPIHYASGLEDEQQAINTCRLLIDLGANVNIRTCYDQVTPLHIAVEKNYANLLELLLSNGGDAESRNVERDTPISLAIEQRSETCIEKIVDNVQRKMKNSRLEKLRASQALLTPSKRTPDAVANLANCPNSPYYVDVAKKTQNKRRSRVQQFIIQEVIEISDSSDSAAEPEEEEDEVDDLDETEYYTPRERSSLNLFELTRENLEEFTKSNRVRNVQRRSLVSRWCDNIRRSDRPITMIDNIKRLEGLFSGYGNDSTILEEQEKDKNGNNNHVEEEQVMVIVGRRRTTTSEGARRSIRESVERMRETRISIRISENRREEAAIPELNSIEEEEQQQEKENSSEKESELVADFIDLRFSDGEEEDEEIIPLETENRRIPEIVITSPDNSIESSLPRLSEYRWPTSDLTRSPDENELWSDEEEDQAPLRSAQASPLRLSTRIENINTSFRGEEIEEELPIIEISESIPRNSQTGVVNESTFDESNFIKSPKNDAHSIEQLVEEYEHRDIECGLKFFELKLVANHNNRFSSQSVNKLINMVGDAGQGQGGASGDGQGSGSSADSTMSSIISTLVSVPLDYDTDALRDELKSFGCNPGPITTTTKRLYLRRLFRYRKDPRRVPANEFDAAVQYFSLELQQTLKPNLKDSVIQEFGKLEKQMELSFRTENRNWRQGNAKKSFIYMLIDPRISQNLPGLAATMEAHEIWKQFLASIFYVGKGKSSRPYAHLYEAMELNRLRGQEVPKKMKDRAKVERILDIWSSDSGVVCLQVFHNIIPAEAFTREGAMIEALGVRSLTNLKAGEFYGIVQGWPQKRKKQLGIYLLFKALRMFLLEGESQISPGDL